jgi:hypothetical protein
MNDIRLTGPGKSLLADLLRSHLEGHASEEILGFAATLPEGAARLEMEGAPVFHLPTLISVGNELGVDVRAGVLAFAVSRAATEAVQDKLRALMDEPKRGVL